MKIDTELEYHYALIRIRRCHKFESRFKSLPDLKNKCKELIADIIDYESMVWRRNSPLITDELIAYSDYLEALITVITPMKFNQTIRKVIINISKNNYTTAADISLTDIATLIITTDQDNSQCYSNLKNDIFVILKKYFT